MIYKVYAPNGYIVRHAGFDIAKNELLGFLWLIYIAKSKNYKVKYNFNYSNTQTITFIDKSNGYKHEFTEVPTTMGTLDINKL